MATEIELKAHVDNIDNLLFCIRNTDGISDEYFQEKRDIYLTNEIDKPPVRCRLVKKIYEGDNISSSLLITVKNKELNDTIEENNEIEIECSSTEFNKSVELFKALGYKETLVKEKTGYSFMFNKYKYPLHIEIIEVKPLGWFFEIEFSIEEKLSNLDISYLKANLMDTLDLFKISHDKIETQYYRDLLNQTLIK